mmetsp:Transcript_47586/g.148860  ORF Transcript_47586/g.148860 Transcript_47586/m.148860 type:complete len:287 (+) Transcript_47586:1695-2555(+)
MFGGDLETASLTDLNPPPPPPPGSPPREASAAISLSPATRRSASRDAPPRLPIASSSAGSDTATMAWCRRGDGDEPAGKRRRQTGLGASTAPAIPSAGPPPPPLPVASPARSAVADAESGREEGRPREISQRSLRFCVSSEPGLRASALDKPPNSKARSLPAAVRVWASRGAGHIPAARSVGSAARGGAADQLLSAPATGRGGCGGNTSGPSSRQVREGTCSAQSSADGRAAERTRPSPAPSDGGWPCWSEPPNMSIRSPRAWREETSAAPCEWRGEGAALPAGTQ